MPEMHRLLMVAAALLAARSPAEGSAQDLPGACPSAHEWAESSVHGFLSNSLLPRLRERYGLGAVSADSIRPLTNARDREACEALWAAVRASGTDVAPSDRLSFFQSAGIFFVSIDRGQRHGGPGVTVLDGNSSLDLYDQHFGLLVRVRA